MRKSLWTATAATAGSAILGWAAWSRYGVPHGSPLPDALDGERVALDTSAGRISFYRSLPDTDAAVRATPLLLVHSVNAAASAYEMKPLYDALRARRPVYAMDLPGFGFAERRARDYHPSVMAVALVSMADEVRRHHPDVPAPDAIALSLSCEFLARAAVDYPDLFSTVGFISPTGLECRSAARIAPGSPAVPPPDAPARMPSGSRRVASALDTGPWSQPLFDLLVTRPSIRHFLRRTFGSTTVPAGLVDYCWRTAHQPGARHAPLSFLAWRPFSEDPVTLYRAVRQPAWLAHGVRGAFARFDGKDALRDRPNWTVDVFDSGAMPQFECPEALLARYDAFIGHRLREPERLHGRPCAYAR